MVGIFSEKYLSAVSENLNDLNAVVFPTFGWLIVLYQLSCINLYVIA